MKDDFRKALKSMLLKAKGEMRARRAQRYVEHEEEETEEEEKKEHGKSTEDSRLADRRDSGRGAGASDGSLRDRKEVAREERREEEEGLKPRSWRDDQKDWMKNKPRGRRSVSAKVIQDFMSDHKRNPADKKAVNVPKGKGGSKA